MNPSNLRKLIVYLDTTYCDPSHNFAKQEMVISEVLSNALSHLTAAKSFSGANSDYQSTFSVLFLVGAYAIGKERVYMALSDKLGVKVHVEQTRLKSLLCLDWSIEDHAKLTASAVTPTLLKDLPIGSVQTKAAILVVNMNQLNFESIRRIENQIFEKTKTKFNKVVAYQPTGWTHTSGVKSPVKALCSAPSSLLKERSRDNIFIYSAPYSEHSSFTELIDFLHTFKPQRVIPTVGTAPEAVKKQLQILKEYSKSIYHPGEESGEITAVTSELQIAQRRRFESEFL